MRTIVNYFGLCLDMTNGSTEDGAFAQLWRCNGEPWQNWGLVPFGDGEYFIENAFSTKCLRVQGSPLFEGRVDQWSCKFDGSDHWQLWKFDPNITGLQTFLNVGAGGRLHPSGNASFDGNEVWVNTGSGAAYLWRMPA